MNQVSTLISSDFQILGQRTCELCGSSVAVIQFRERKISECLNCDTHKLQKEIQDQVDHQERNKHLTVFKKYSIIPDDIKNARFSNYKPSDHSSKLEAKRAAMKFVQEFQEIKDSDQHSLLFQGPYGLGKSHLAHAITKELTNKGFTAIYIDVPQLLQLFRDNIKKQNINENDLIKTISDCDLLILDDLGAEYIKKENGKESWAVDKLFQVLSARNGKAKVITTNYGSQGLIEKYGTHGGRIVSRMMMGTKVIKFEGKDFRINGF